MYLAQAYVHVHTNIDEYIFCVKNNVAENWQYGYEVILSCRIFTINLQNIKISNKLQSEVTPEKEAVGSNSFSYC